MKDKRDAGHCHVADLLVVEGSNGNVNCDWKNVELGRSDMVREVIQRAGEPYKTYRVLADRECGWLGYAKRNEEYYFKITSKVVCFLEWTNE